MVDKHRNFTTHSLMHALHLLVPLSSTLHTQSTHSHSHTNQDTVHFASQMQHGQCGKEHMVSCFCSCTQHANTSMARHHCFLSQVANKLALLQLPLCWLWQSIQPFHLNLAVNQLSDKVKHPQHKLIFPVPAITFALDSSVCHPKLLM